MCGCVVPRIFVLYSYSDLFAGKHAFFGKRTRSITDYILRCAYCIVGSHDDSILILYVLPNGGSTAGNVAYLFEDGTIISAPDSGNALKQYISKKCKKVTLVPIPNAQALGNPLKLMDTIIQRNEGHPPSELYVDITRNDRSKAFSLASAVKVLTRLLPETKIHIVYAGWRVTGTSSQHANVGQATGRPTYAVKILGRPDEPADIANAWFGLDSIFKEYIDSLLSDLEKIRRSHVNDRQVLEVASEWQKVLGIAKKVFWHLYFSLRIDSKLFGQAMKATPSPLNNIAAVGAGTREQLETVLDLLHDFTGNCAGVPDYRLCQIRFYEKYGHLSHFVLFVTEYLKDLARMCIRDPKIEYGSTRQVSELIHNRDARDCLLGVYAKAGCEDVLKQIIDALDELVDRRNKIAHGANPSGGSILNLQTLNIDFDTLVELTRKVQECSS